MEAQVDWEVVDTEDLGPDPDNDHLRRVDVFVAYHHHGILHTRRTVHTMTAAEHATLRRHMKDTP